jgi:hypothetical protein
MHDGMDAEGKTMKSRIMVFILAFLSACSTAGWDPVDHHVALEPASSEYVEMSGLTIRKVGKGVTVFGELNPRQITQEIPPGHVSVTLVSRDGATIIEKSTHLDRIGKLFKRPQRYSFTATLPLTPPEGSTIRLEFVGDP